MAQGSAKKSGSAPKIKHVPQRTCIACRRSDAKRGLIRLVRDAAGRVSVDLAGKRPGRGAYLCHDLACWEASIKRRAIERALKIEQLHPDDRAALLDYARTLESIAAPDAPTDASRSIENGATNAQ
jgi:hypothetical protein